MGGGKKFAYPTWVWSPAGGWWANPTHWKRNSIAFVTVSFLIAGYVYSVGERNTITYSPKTTTTAASSGSHHH